MKDMLGPFWIWAQVINEKEVKPKATRLAMKPVEARLLILVRGPTRASESDVTR
jgi:hypothetical protein